MHIAIAGNIGSGKTTLTKMLSKRYGWTPHFEPVDNNPYLEDYYADMKRWSFNLQIYFLNKRFRDVVEISKSSDTIIQDRTIFESLVELPDLMIYIRSSIPNIVEQIEKRGRDYEKSIRIDYLQGLNARYEEWIAGYKGKLMIVDGDKLKFESNPKDFQQITDTIDAELYGLFPFQGDK